MPIERFFIDDELSKDIAITLSGTEFHHLSNVMRLTAEDILELVNGQGKLAKARIVKVGKKSATIRIEDVISASYPTQDVILAQAFARQNRLEYIVEKGTELGMTELWLFPGKRSEKQELSQHQLDRLRSIAIASMKQCGRLFLPNIKLMPTLDKWKTQNVKAYYGDINPVAPHLSQVWTKPTGPVLFFIGPESGFTEEEHQMLRTLHAKGVHLHQNILRTDTAAINALSIVAFLLHGSDAGNFDGSTLG